MRVLSGGEKVRVLLSRMMIMGSNVLMFSLDLLLAAALYYVPVINEWFYPQLAKKQLGRKAVVDKA